MLRLLSRVVLLCLFLSSCVPVPAAKVNAPKDWWTQAVFYEIFVRSFFDSDGDGTGDFNGLTEKLDYLNDGNPATGEDLGITALWLMPIFPSPSYHGYDVTDYYAVNPQYGTMEDFKRLLAEAHRRDIHVIIDLVINHTSSQHPWFLEAQADPQSKYRDWYVWADIPPAGVQGWRQGQKGSYYAYFDAGMPDLNYRNPEVTAEIGRITSFWLKDVGVDGFRIDAAKHLYEDGDKRENLPETLDWFQKYRQTYKAVNPQAYAVGEVYGAGALLVKRYSGDKLDQVFNFELGTGILNSVRGGASSGVNSAIKFAQMDMPDWNFATFLTNHDQDRVMSVLGGSTERAKTAATLLLTLPGTPFLYYGEEIGMQGVKPDEEIRRPMQWTGDVPNAGFTTGSPWRLPDQDHLSVNVAAQISGSDSLRSHYRRLIALRREHLSFGSSSLLLFETGNPGVFAMLRHGDTGIVLILVNLTDMPIVDYRLSLAQASLSDGEYALKSLWDHPSADALMKVSGGAVEAYQPLPSLDPYATAIFKVESR